MRAALLSFTVCSARSTASRRACQTVFGGGPMCVTVTGNNWSESGSMPHAEKIAVSFADSLGAEPQGGEADGGIARTA